MPKKEIKEEKSSKRVIYVIGVIVFALIIINVLLLFGVIGDKGVACYMDACIYGERDPVQEYRDLILSSDKIILVAEGDVDPTQTTAFIDASLAQLSKDFGLKNPMIIGIGLEAGNPVDCICEDYNGENFTRCDSSLQTCLDIQPNESSFMIYIKYPTFEKDEIFIKGRTIEIRGKSGEDVLALVYLLKDLKV